MYRRWKSVAVEIPQNILLVNEKSNEMTSWQMRLRQIDNAAAGFLLPQVRRHFVYRVNTDKIAALFR